MGDAAPAVPAAKPSFFGEGGTGRAIGGYLGDALLRMSGAAPVYQPFVQQQRQQQFQQQQYERQRADQNEDWQTQHQWEADHQPPQIVQTGHGGVVSVDPRTGTATTIRENDAAAEPAAVQIARAAGLTPGTPEWKAALTAAVPGYSSTAPVMQARADLSLRNRTAPTYANLHPRSGGGGGRGGKAPRPPSGFILD